MSYLQRTNGGSTFTGSDVDLFRLIVLAQALELYHKHKMITTRGATPTRLLRMAAEYTGRTFKGATKYQDAADAVRAIAEAAKSAPRVDVPGARVPTAAPVQS